MYVYIYIYVYKPWPVGVKASSAPRRGGRCPQRAAAVIIIELNATGTRPCVYRCDLFMRTGSAQGLTLKRESYSP